MRDGRKCEVAAELCAYIPSAADMAAAWTRATGARIIALGALNARLMLARDRLIIAESAYWRSSAFL